MLLVHVFLVVLVIIFFNYSLRELDATRPLALLGGLPPMAVEPQLSRFDSPRWIARANLTRGAEGAHLLQPSFAQNIDNDCISIGWALRTARPTSIAPSSLLCLTCGPVPRFVMLVAHIKSQGTHILPSSVLAPGRSFPCACKRS